MHSSSRNGQANKQVRRAVLGILSALASIAEPAGLDHLFARSAERTFGQTDGREWTALASAAKTLSTLVAYDFARAWLNGIADCRRWR